MFDRVAKHTLRENMIFSRKNTQSPASFCKFLILPFWLRELSNFDRIHILQICGDLLQFSKGYDASSYFARKL